MDVIYVLVTAARNEEVYIEKTIKAVISQTTRPKKWVIVSDGSTDRTDEIIKLYANKYAFIQYVRVESQRSRDFASKVYAIREGLKFLRRLDFSFLGNLDADVSIEPNYYECVLSKFQENPKLGKIGRAHV